MGYFKHEALIILGNGEKDRNKIIEFVKKERGMRKYFSISKIFINDYFSAILWPDGSKEGWDTSEKVNGYRNKLKKFLKENKFSYGNEYVHLIISEDVGDYPRIEDSHEPLLSDLK